MQKIAEASESEDGSGIDESETETETDADRKRALWNYYGRHQPDAPMSPQTEEDDIVGLLLASSTKENDTTTAALETTDTRSAEVPEVKLSADVLDGWSDDEGDEKLLASDDVHEVEPVGEFPSRSSFRNTSSDDLSSDDGIFDGSLKVSGRYSGDISSSSVEPVIAKRSWSIDEDADEVANNCYGVVHVQLIRARNLLCPIHTQVQAVLRLLPWKGCVRIEKVTADFSADSVSATWPQGTLASMVHSYSEGSPFPSLQIELMMVTPLFLEFKMATLNVDCESLFRCPGSVCHQWFQTDKEPIIEVQAWFEPSGENDDLTTTHAESISNFLLENVSLVGDGKQQTDHDMESATQTTKARPIHLLHHFSYKTTPANCCVCNKSIFWSSGSLQCESCRVDCCEDCRLSVDVSLPCGSDVAQTAVETAVQSKWTMERVLNVIAPVASTQQSDSRGVEEAPPGSEGAIGTLQIVVGKAVVLQEAIPPTTDPAEMLSGISQLREGDYYIRVGSCRTRTIQHSQGCPNFDNHPMRISVPHYGAEYRLDLIDGSTDLIVGSAMLNTQILLQQQRDVLVETLPFASFVKPLLFNKLRTARIELRYYGSKEVSSVDFFSQPKHPGGESDLARPGDIVGCVDIHTCLEENWSCLFSKSPYECPPRPSQDLDMGVFQLQIQRYVRGLRQNAAHREFWIAFLLCWKMRKLALRHISTW